MGEGGDQPTLLRSYGRQAEGTEGTEVVEVTLLQPLRLLLLLCLRYPSPMDFIVLSSSRGTTLQAVLDAIKEGSLTAHCLGLIADREDRGCVAKARAAEIPVTIVERKKDEDRESYDKRLDGAIRDLVTHNPKLETLLAAIGWMFLFSPWFVAQWKNRIVNVHPALLPKHPGANAIRDTLAAGDTETGMTIHLIDEGVDTGPILLQKTCAVLPEDTEETLKERIQALEKEWYPKVLEMMNQGDILPRAYGATDSL